MNIGFIGLGNMGFWMATNILKAGYRLTVYDIQKEAMNPLLEAGASPAGNVKDLAAASDMILTSLPGPPEDSQASQSNPPDQS